MEKSGAGAGAEERALPSPPPDVRGDPAAFSRWFRKHVEPRAALALRLASSDVGMSGSLRTASMLRLLDALNPADDPDTRFLDVGSGTGIVLLLTAMRPTHLFSFDEGMPMDVVLRYLERASHSLRRFISFRLSPRVVHRLLPSLPASHVLRGARHLLSVSCPMRGSGSRYSGHVWEVLPS